MEEINTLYQQLGITSTLSIQEIIIEDEFKYHYYEDQKYNRWRLSKWNNLTEKGIYYQDNNLIIDNA
jgi:hypothetical protein